MGENSFNQVFFTDVHVPTYQSSSAKRGEGWKIANTTLKHERNSLNANAEGTLLRLMKLMQKRDHERRFGYGEPGLPRSPDAAAGEGSEP